MSLVSEYKLQAIWSIKRKTFNAQEVIESKNFKTTLPDNVEYSFVMRPGKNEYSIVSILVNKCVSIKEMKLSIPSANFQGDLSTAAFDPEDGSVWQNTAFIKNTDLFFEENTFLEDEILTMKICGTLCYETTSRNVEELLWTDNAHKDFTFIIGASRKVKIHKFILGHFSSKLLYYGNPNQKEIKRFDKSVVEDVVGLCYGRKIEFSYADESTQIFALFKRIGFCNDYDMPLIKEQMELHLKDYIEKETVCMLANKSVEYKANTLRALCINFLINCIKEGKPFDGCDTLNGEILAEVFKNSFCHNI